MCCCTKSAQWKIALVVGIILALSGIAITLLIDEWIWKLVGDLLITAGVAGIANSYYQSLTGIKWDFWIAHMLIVIALFLCFTFSYSLLLDIDFIKKLEGWGKVIFEVVFSAIIGCLSNGLIQMNTNYFEERNCCVNVGREAILGLAASCFG